MSKEGGEACMVVCTVSMMEEEVHTTKTQRNAYRRRRMSVVAKNRSPLDMPQEKKTQGE